MKVITQEEATPGWGLTFLRQWEVPVLMTQRVQENFIISDRKALLYGACGIKTEDLGGTPGQRLNIEYATCPDDESVVQEHVSMFLSKWGDYLGGDGASTRGSRFGDQAWDSASMASINHMASGPILV